MRKSAIVLILYSASLAFYGALEVAHDLLHYLATHHDSHLHDHSHGDHHNIHHHGHGKAPEQLAAEVEDGFENTLPSLTHNFLYTEDTQRFSFDNLSGQIVSLVASSAFPRISFPPTVPPPRS